LRCRILNIGLDSGIHGSLKTQLEAEGLISLQHIDMEVLAISVLRQIPASELPHLVLVRHQLPVTTTLDLIAQMRSLPRLQAVRILVWGSSIPSHQVDWLYRAGAACVLPSQLNLKHLDIMREFSRVCTEAGGQKKEPRHAIAAPLLTYGEKDVRNVKLGALFVWTGCISAILWMSSFLQLARSSTRVDLMPLPVYAALAWAGISLIGRTRGHGRIDLTSRLK
jgi:CheY-like chemotaxis protein